MAIAAISERVAAGAAWLDNHVPDWRNKVEVRNLEMDSTCNCVLGQVFEDEGAAQDDWETSLSGFAVGEIIAEQEGLDVSELGFDTMGLPVSGYATQAEEFEALRQEWIRVINSV